MRTSHLNVRSVIPLGSTIEGYLPITMYSPRRMLSDNAENPS